MRKAVAILLVLVLGTCLGAATAVRELAATQNQVVFTETTLYGDISAAEGLTVTKQVQMSGNIAWNSTLRFFNAGFTYKTTSDYYNNVWEMNLGEPFYDGVFLYDMISSSYQTSGSDLSFLASGMSKAQAELADQTPDGEIRARTIRLADYYEYYPIEANISLPNVIYGGFSDMLTEEDYNSPELYAARAMIEFFKIPVLPDERYTIGIEKGENGTIISSWGQSVDGRDAFSISTSSVVAEDACYFYFSNRTYNGRLVDTSRIPGGYGIYVLPYGWVKAEDYHGYDFYEGGDVFVDQLRVFYPIDPEAEILDLSLSDNQKTLLLHTAEKGKCLLTIISTETGEALQKLELGDYRENLMTEAICTDGALIVRIGESFSVLVPQSDTEWKLLYQTVPTEIEKGENFSPLNTWYGREFAFDGERLAVISTLSAEGWTGCGFSLAVYNSEGLQYYGSYQSSLDKANETKGFEDPFDNPVTFSRISEWNNPNGVTWTAS